MAYLGNDKLNEILPKIISPFDGERIKSAHYELCLGEEAFVTGLNKDKVIQLTEKDNSVSIEPGQFALLLTREKVEMPEDKIAFISIKAGQKFKGLINISGFHVDPGFKGKLLFSVFNAGPSKIILERDQKYFLIWFSHLEGNDFYNGAHNNQDRIPIKHIEKLSGELASPNSVLKKISALETNYESSCTSLRRQRNLNQGAKTTPNLRSNFVQNTLTTYSFASTALSSAGGTLPQVGELLGPSRPDTTARYAHFMTAPKLELANRTAEVLNEWLS